MAPLTRDPADVLAPITPGFPLVTRTILIVNADDFGQSLGINHGVIQAHERGIVTSATLMVRWPAAAHAAEYAKSRPELSLGLHLDLAEWHYREAEGWLQRYEVAPPDDERAVRDEIERQLDAFLGLVDRPPTHLDSHQHVHLTQPVSRLLVEAGRRLGVPVRHLPPGPSYNGSFYGQDSRGSPLPAAITVESLVSIIEGLPEGVTELACHPGEGTDVETAYGRERATEVATLCSPRVRAALEDSGIELRSFADFNWQRTVETVPAGAAQARPSPNSSEPARRHAFRFAVTAGERVSGNEWRAICRKVEDLGFSTVFVPDHLGNQLAPMPALTAAAAHTTTLRLGLLVSCNDFRHPGVHAKELATLDVLSEGRVEWGMGAGWLESEFASAGIPFHRSAVRVDRLGEAVAVMKGLFADGPVTHQGEHYQLNSLEGLPKPLQRPHPPLLVGGSRKRMLTLATREAQIVGVAPSWTARRIGSAPPTQTVELAADTQVRWIREAAGSRFDDIEINMVAFPAVVTDDRETLATSFADGLGLEPSEVLVSPHVWIGTVDQICESLSERRERWGVSYWVVPATAVDAVAPVVARLADS
jgi:probable F420-dependent oxidoreductase